MLKLLLIAAGGAVGALLRYWVSGAAQNATGSTFPIGTLVVNVLGCIAIGGLSALFADRLLIREEYRIAIMIGLLGGFTTFSTYIWETFSLANDNQRWWALANLAASNVLGLTGAWIAYRVVQGLHGGPST